MSLMMALGYSITPRLDEDGRRSCNSTDSCIAWNYRLGRYPCDVLANTRDPEVSARICMHVYVHAYPVCR
jgi:hypothetical protein